MSASLQSITFETRTPPTLAELLLFPKILRWLPSLGAKMVFSPRMEGLSLNAAIRFFLDDIFPGSDNDLIRLMRDAYKQIGRNSLYSKCGSAVPYFTAANRHMRGQAFVYCPDKMNSSTPVLLLLHGYGGNLLYFPWAIQQAIPHVAFVAPSWQIAWTQGTDKERLSYLEDALRAAESHLGRPISRPWLCGLSNGGMAAFQLMTASPDSFSGLIGISTDSPYGGNTGRLNGLPVHILYGMQDGFFSFREVAGTIEGIARAGGVANLTWVEDATHWLLLSHRERLKEFMSRIFSG